MKRITLLTLLLLTTIPLGCSDRNRLHGRPVQAWIQQLQSTDEALRLRAVKVLTATVKSTFETSHFADPTIVGALDGALRDRRPDIRFEAALALAWVGRETGMTVPVLVEALRDSGIPALHETATLTLAYPAKGAESSLALLLKQLEASLPELEPVAIAAGASSQTLERAAALAARAASPAEADALAALDELGALGQSAALPALQTALASPNPRLRLAAARALARLGTPAFPLLEKIVERLAADDHADVRAAAANAMMRIDPRTGSSVYYLRTALGDPDAGVRSAAAEGLGDFGSSAREVRTAVAPEMLAEMIAPRTAAMRILDPAIPPLLKALRDDSPAVRGAAAMTLGRIAPNAEKVIPPLLAACGDSQPTVRAAAAWALGELGAEGPAVQAQLQAMLKDAQPAVRAQALLALVQSAHNDAPVLPLLEAAAGDPAPEVRAAFLSALAEIGPGNVMASKTLGDALLALARQPDPALRRDALVALSRVELHTAVALQELTRALEDKDPEVVLSAIDALGWMGPAADHAVPALDKVYRTGTPEARQAATIALGWIDHQSTETMHRLVKEVQTPEFWRQNGSGKHPPHWRETLLLLGWKGPEAWAAAPYAAGLLRDRHNPPLVRLTAGMALAGMSSETLPLQLAPVFQTARQQTHERQLHAVTALIWLGDRAAPAIPELVRLLQTPNCATDLRVAAAAALGKMGTGAAGAIPALSDVMRQADAPRVKAAVAAVLGAMGAGGKTATPPLIAALRDADPDVREASALALGQIAMDAPFAVPALGKSLGDADPRVRLAAAMALGGYGPQARETQPTLQNLANADADSLVRKAAKSSLKKIAGE